ncbi:glycosyltransferase [Micromonospora sp. WMMD558]|uniref:glycosyltransferase n=1 Tax=unclassified Micromonospora TaxID=2617518 RepID=UPI0018AF9A67|nr:glycosyltransferase [Micromonospora sp. WMMC415]
MPPDGTWAPRSRAVTPAAVVGWLAIIAALGVTTVLPRPTVAGFLGLVAVAVCLAALYQTTLSGTFTPVAVTFWAFVAVWVGFAPLLQIRDRRLPWPDLPLDQHYVSAQVILLFAVVAWWVGNTRRVPAPRPSTSRRTRLTIEKAVVVTGLAVVLAVVCLPMTGGLAVRFTSRDDLQRAIAEEGLKSQQDLALLGLLSTFPAAVSAVALVLCLVCWRSQNWADRRGRSMVLTATGTAVVLNLIYNNPLSANRFAAFGVLLAAGLAIVRFDRQIWRTLFSIGMLLGLAVIYPLANLFRNERSRGNLRLGLDAYYTWDFDGFQQTVNAVHHVGVGGHTWGHHFISALLFWVPRSVWEGKAIPAGNAVAASRGYEFQNLALPFWAETYLEFSFVGVVVLFFFYGKLARRLDIALTGPAASLGTALTVMFAALQIGLLRGPLGAQIPFVGAAFVVLVVGVAAWAGPQWGLTRTPTPVDDRPPADDPTGRVVEKPWMSDPLPKVAVLADWWWPNDVGGAERSAREAALELARSAQVSVFVPAAVETSYTDGPLSVHAVRRPFARRVHADTRVRRGLEFISAWLVPWTASRLARRIRAFHPDVVVATNVSRTGPWLLRSVKADGLRYVRVFHDLSDTCWRRSRLKGARSCETVCGECQVKARIMRNATPRDAVSVCVSGFVRDELVASGLVNPAESLVGYPLIGPAEPVRVPRRNGDGLVIGYIGRVSPVKGIESAIRTAAAYQRRTGITVTVLVAGTGQAAYVRALVELARAEGVDIRVPGHLPVDEFCRLVDVVLIPSRWMEPFGRVAVEVGRAGKPMLVSPLGGLPEAAAVSGGDYAFADFQDPQAAAVALAGLLDGSARKTPSAASATTAGTLKEGVVAAARHVLSGAVEMTAGRQR